MIEDLLGGKAPATLRKRYRSILGYDLFLRARGIGFPGSEDLFYAYLCKLRDDGKPASTRKAVLEAVTFVRFVLGIPELATLGESKRCHGSARLRDFKARVQASPFTVEELTKLHRILFEDLEPWNRLMAGSILCCTYGRARWEDLEHADLLIVDRGDDGVAAFIEVGVGVHKTMGAKIMRGQLLPLVAPAVGVVEGNWVEQFIKVRVSLGLQDPPHGPIMPAPDRQGMPTVRSLDSDEAGAWVRLLLYGSRVRLRAAGFLAILASAHASALPLSSVAALTSFFFWVIIPGISRCLSHTGGTQPPRRCCFLAKSCLLSGRAPLSQTAPGADGSWVRGLVSASKSRMKTSLQGFQGTRVPAQLNMPVGLSVVSMLALWSGLHLLSVLRWVMVSPMQGLPALAAVQILGGRVTKTCLAIAMA